MTQAQVEMQLNIGENSFKGSSLPQKSKKIRKLRVQKPSCTILPVIVEVRKTGTKPHQSPRVILDHGWTLFFGDEIGNSAENGYLNIRNQQHIGIGVCIPAELFECLIQGLNQLKRKW